MATDYICVQIAVSASAAFDNNIQSISQDWSTESNQLQIFMQENNRLGRVPAICCGNLRRTIGQIYTEWNRDIVCFLGNNLEVLQIKYFYYFCSKLEGAISTGSKECMWQVSCHLHPHSCCWLQSSNHDILNMSPIPHPHTKLQHNTCHLLYYKLYNTLTHLGVHTPISE